MLQLSPAVESVGQVFQGNKRGLVPKHCAQCGYLNLWSCLDKWIPDDTVVGPVVVVVVVVVWLG